MKRSPSARFPCASSIRPATPRARPASCWNDLPSPCPKHDVPMRAFFVDRVYKPQIVMVCPKGEMFRFDQRPKQIEFSRGHVKTMVLDAQEREFPGCPQD